MKVLAKECPPPTPIAQHVVMLMATLGRWGREKGRGLGKGGGRELGK